VCPNAVYPVPDRDPCEVRSVPALGNAGPDCDACGGHVILIVQSKKNIDVLVSYKTIIKYVRELWVVSHCIFLKITIVRILHERGTKLGHIGAIGLGRPWMRPTKRPYACQKPRFDRRLSIAHQQVSVHVRGRDKKYRVFINYIAYNSLWRMQSVSYLNIITPCFQRILYGGSQAFWSHLRRKFCGCDRIHASITFLIHHWQSLSTQGFFWWPKLVIILDLMLPPRCWWDLRSSGMLHGVVW
jgi:hypothetical protein